jgi:hypothetical protein
MSQCRHCSRSAEFAVVGIVSTLRIKPRLQKCSRSEAFCKNCLRRLLNGEIGTASTLLGPVNDAYTELCRQLRQRSKANSKIESD